MTRYEIKQLRDSYRGRMPSVVIVHEGVQYYCANWSSMDLIREKLGFDHMRECDHTKFDLENWHGTKDELIMLLNICDQAKRDQVNKYGAIGWYVIWSDEGLSFVTHI